MSSLLNVVVSDPHCGSDVGLLPDKVKFDDGHSISAGDNPWQKWMWERWKHTVQRVKKIAGKDPFVLTLNGDLIEGVHHRSDEVVAMKMMEHLKIAQVALQPLISAAQKTHVIRGTECHTHDFETFLAREIGAGRAHDFLQYEMNGVLIDARHHMPVTGRLHLEASALSIVMAYNRSNAVRAGHRPARVFLRGHRHLTGHYSDGESMICVTGAWQGLTRHGKKVVSDAVPRPSVVILDFRGREKGELPTVHQIAHNPPQALAISQ